LASLKRIRILQHVLKEPNSMVTEIALALNLPLSAASEHLRALNARGLTSAHRRGRLVRYGPGLDRSLPVARLLLRAVRRTINTRPDSSRFIFHQATAFTHPRRVQIYQALAHASMTTWQLVGRTGISRRALYRHLIKLEQRGFARYRGGLWHAAQPAAIFSRALVRCCLAS
jgi:DNA-binding transcriptional ArsR family regulator